MARFKKINPRIWKDEKFVVLNRDAKLIALYCLTAQTSRIGIFSFSPALASEDLGLSIPKFMDAFDTVCHTLFWEYDKACRVLYIPTWWKYNCPDNTKAMKGYLQDLQEIPATPLLDAFYKNTRYLTDTVSSTFQECTTYPMPYPMPYKEKEKEKDKEIEKDKDKRNTNRAPPGAPACVTNIRQAGDKIIDSWNLAMGTKRTLTAGLTAAIKRNLKADPDYADKYTQAAPIFPQIDTSGWDGGAITLEWSLRLQNARKEYEPTVDRVLSGVYRLNGQSTGSKMTDQNIRASQAWLKAKGAPCE